MLGKYDAEKTLNTFDDLVLIELLREIKPPFKTLPDWDRLEKEKSVQHDNLSLHYTKKIGRSPDPYCGGETGGAILDIIYSAQRQIRIDHAEIAWISPQIYVYHRGCPEVFDRWLKALQNHPIIR